jgi:hypothetical protein
VEEQVGVKAVCDGELKKGGEEHRLGARCIHIFLHRRGQLTAGKGENNGALALEEVLGGHVLPVERVVAADLLISDAALEGHDGDGVSLLARHAHGSGGARCESGGGCEGSRGGQQRH